MATNTSTSDVQLNLDALDSEGAVEPFRFTLGGETFEAADPRDLDWREVEAIDTSDYNSVLKSMLTEESYERFLNHKVSVRALDRLSEAVVSHYGMVNSGEGDAS